MIEGHFPGVEKYPLLLGHETVGIVEAIGEKVRSFKVGERLVGGLLLKAASGYTSGWGGFSEYTIAGDHKAMLEDGVADAEHGWAEVYEIMQSVPSDIPVEAAVLLCTWREVYAAFDDFNLKAGQNILIFGAGPVGLSFVKFAHLIGVSYIGVVEFSKEKQQLARQMGASQTFDPDSPEIKTISATLGRPLDAVIDAVGRESIINAALPLIKLGGSICVYGVLDQDTIQVRKNEGPYNFNLLIHQWPTRSGEAAALAPLTDWIRTGKLNYQEFISADVPIQSFVEAYDFSKTGKLIKTILRF